MKDIIKLRHALHQKPELAFKETATGLLLKNYLSKYQPTKVLAPIAETGMAFIFEGKKNKPAILFRSDLDALPIHETLDVTYCSVNKNVSHKCGHDGHMAMVASIAEGLSQISNRGDVILYFQPAEETGEGALRSLADEKFQALKIDYVFALHNLPEKPCGKVVLSKNTFACCSVGLKIKIAGKSSHAAEPELAHSPFGHLTSFALEVENLNHNVNDKNYFISTLTHAQLGEESFGITPGTLVLYYTLRAAEEKVLDNRKEQIQNLINKRFSGEFKVEVCEQDYYPATENHKDCVEMVEKACKEKEIQFEYLQSPIKWSEDFGYFTKKYKGCYFGLGIESEHALHTPEYDFNDNVIEVGQALFLQIIRTINSTN